jgi:3-phosphoshikimate 1-carboxyvinyltransferase
MKELFDELENHGVTITHSKESVLPCVVSGKCENSNFSICGNVSSQYITGLVLSLPIMKKGEVEIVGKIESKPYIDITLSVMREFGFSVIDEYGKLVYNGYNDLDFEEYSVEGDFSNAAFFVVGGLIGAKDGLEIFGLSRETKQGDKAIIDIMTRFGGRIDEVGNSLIVYSSSLQGTTVDVSDTPDLAPIIAVAGAAAKGETVIRGCARLREKESDRIESTVSLINGLGGNARVNGDSIIIQGNGKLRGGKVSSFGDHRIAMSAAIASLICEDEVIIDGAEAINKSFPRFFEIFDSLN